VPMPREWDNYTLGCRPFASPRPCEHSVQNPTCEYHNIDYLRYARAGRRAVWVRVPRCRHPRHGQEVRAC
jgi:hypothetical protein